MLIGDKIRDHRKRRGLTQAELARLTGFSPAFICNIEKGKYKLKSSDTLSRIAKVLKIRPEELYVAAGLIHDKKGIYSTPAPKTPDDALRDLELSMPVAVPILADMHAPGEIIEYTYIARDKPAPKNLVGVLVRGYCLEPEIRDGDIIIIDKDAVPDDGKIILCYHNEHDRPELFRYKSPVDLKSCIIYGVIFAINRRL